MKIAIEGLPTGGRVVTFGLHDPWATAAAATSLERPPASLDGTIGLKRASDSKVVVVDVKATAAAPATCDRCGEPCTLSLSADTRMLYAPEESSGAAFDGIAIDDPSAEVDGEIELRSDDLDLGWYKDGAIALDDVLCEVLSLEFPARVVCADGAECDKRTDALLAASRGDDGPFAMLRGLRPASASDSEDPLRAQARADERERKGERED